MKQDRKPEYHKCGHQRVVSRPNGFWAAQFRARPDNRPKRKTTDIWEDHLGASKLSYEQAVARMSSEAGKAA